MRIPSRRMTHGFGFVGFVRLVLRWLIARSRNLRITGRPCVLGGYRRPEQSVNERKVVSTARFYDWILFCG